MKTQQNHTQLTEQLLATQQLQPVLYTETGSRGYGIATNSSDYDLRGVHLLPKALYYHFLPQTEVLERVDITQGLDFVSYSWDKFLNMLLKSNPNGWEMWRAEAFYLNYIPDFERVRQQSLQLVDFNPLYQHYLSLVKSHAALVRKKASHKAVFYGIRGLICAKIAARRELPALKIADLLLQFAADNSEDKDIARFLSESLHYKQHEPQTMLTAYQQQFFTDMLGYYHQKMLDDIPNLGHQQPNPDLAELLQSLNLTIKTQFYG